MERINTLVTLAYSRDPRLAKKGGKGGAGGDKKGGDKAAAAEKAAALKKRQPEEVKAMEAADAESVKLRRAFREREKKLAKRAARDLKLAGPAAAGVDEAAIDAALARPPPAPTAVELHALLFGPDKVADVPPSNKDAPPAPVAGGGEKLKAAIKA